MSAICRARIVVPCVLLMLFAAFSYSAIVAKDAGRRAVSSNDKGSIVADGYQEIDRRLSEFIERELKDKGIPAASIAAVDGDKVVIAKGFGAQSADGKQPATANSIYRVGSVSKLFTDLCVMRLVAEGKLDLDADVRKYLPEFAPHNPFGVPITLRHLMSHQSGLVRESPAGHYFDDTSPSLAATVASLKSTTLIYKPGTRTKYSNAGVSVAGFVVEKLVGKPFEQHIRDVLLDPLDMPVAGFLFTDEMKNDYAVGWMRSHHAPPFIAPNFALGTLPAGNLYSSMNELSHLLIATFSDGEYGGKKVIEPKLLESMLKPVMASDDKSHDYGIGFRLGAIDGHRTFGHGGAVYGYSTQLVGLPKEKVGVVASASIDGANGVVKRLTEYAVRLLLAKKGGKTAPAIEPTKPIPREVAQKLVGTYAGGSKFLRIVDEGEEVYLFDDAYRKRLRSSNDDFVIDDLTGFGPKMKLTEDGELLMNDRAWKRVEEPLPASAPSKYKKFIGEYGWDHNVLYIYEDRGQALGADRVVRFLPADGNIARRVCFS